MQLDSQNDVRYARIALQGREQLSEAHGQKDSGSKVNCCQVDQWQEATACK